MERQDLQNRAQGAVDYPIRRRQVRHDGPQRQGFRSLLQWLQQRHALAVASLHARLLQVQPDAIRCLLPDQRVLRAQAAAAGHAGRRHLGARLSPDTARRGAQARRRAPADRLFPARAVSAVRRDALAALLPAHTA